MYANYGSSFMRKEYASGIPNFRNPINVKYQNSLNDPIDSPLRSVCALSVCVQPELELAKNLNKTNSIASASLPSTSAKRPKLPSAG